MWQIPCFTRYFWFFSFVIFPTGPSSIYIFIVSSYFAKCQKGYVGIVISKPSLDYLEVQYVHFHSRDTLSSLHFWRLPLTLSSILYIYIYIYISDLLHARLTSYYKAWSYKKKQKTKMQNMQEICLERIQR